MGIFDRLSTLIRSNINDLISRAENPEKMLNQLIVDMRTQLAKAKQQVAAAIADEKRLAAQVDQENKAAEEGEGEGARRQERGGDVREEDGADRARRAQAHRGGGVERGSVGQHAAQAVPVDRSEGRRGSAAARLEAQAGAPAGGLPGRGEAPRKGRGRGGAG